ncbi:hypothetical protein STSP1_02180 [Sedimentisphaera salicampi]|uniref:Uncharacterized protein n=1 Tax=Sedimentisphaera salicampi TaxID=1941349 RepID=A0A1W6LPR7_9BACT|nr:hypothetical protein STSP1_02180 [Sedimentisphaera salicampi]OXU14315.1 hypothetical protein SMSP1_02083 [Sedimentisphaera salicampi]
MSCGADIKRKTKKFSGFTIAGNQPDDSGSADSGSRAVKTRPPGKAGFGE